jgi:putative aldouronate transport system permease protein
LPQFLSWLAVVGLATSMYAIYGPINDLIMHFGGTERVMFLSNQSLFIPNLVFLNLWKTVGWDSIIYLAAITGIDSQLYEAAKIDGASRFKQIIHITIPGIMPTTIILLILAMGRLFNDNFELIYGLQNPFINFEVISTVVYKNGIVEGKYSIATAFGFMQGVIAFILMAISNKISNKLSGVSIW